MDVSTLTADAGRVQPVRLTVTTSVGVASAGAVGELDALVELADERLYWAKNAGRDRLVGGEGPPVIPIT